VLAEDAERTGFGADFLSADKKAAAGYSMFGAGALNQLQGYENPERAVASRLSFSGTIRINFGKKDKWSPVFSSFLTKLIRTRG